MARSRPYVILGAAMSIDGKIATRTHQSSLSSKKDLLRVHKLRSNVNAILVGKNTVFADNPLLTVRHVKGENPTRIILDSKASITSTSKIVKTARRIHTIVVVSQNAQKQSIARLERRGVEVIACGRNRINLKKLLVMLQKKGIHKILLEGGGITNWYFLKERLVDEIILTVTPFVLGGKDAVSLVEGFGFDKVSKAPSFRLKKIVRMKNELVLHYVF